MTDAPRSGVVEFDLTALSRANWSPMTKWVWLGGGVFVLTILVAITASALTHPPIASRTWTSLGVVWTLAGAVVVMQFWGGLFRAGPGATSLRLTPAGVELGFPGGSVRHIGWGDRPFRLVAWDATKPPKPAEAWDLWLTFPRLPYTCVSSQAMEALLEAAREAGLSPKAELSSTRSRGRVLKTSFVPISAPLVD